MNTAKPDVYAITMHHTPLETFLRAQRIVRNFDSIGFAAYFVAIFAFAFRNWSGAVDTLTAGCDVAGQLFLILLWRLVDRRFIRSQRKVLDQLTTVSLSGPVPILHTRRPRASRAEPRELIGA